MNADHLLLQGFARHRIERAEGFIHQQHFRVGGQRARHADALLLAAGKADAGSVRAGPAPAPARPSAHRPAPGSSAATTFAAAGRWQCSAPPSSGGTGRWTGWRRPILRRSSSTGCWRISCPAKRIVPLSCSTRRLIIFSVVDFPEPEVPISTENAPSRRCRFEVFHRRLSGKRLY
ncbi:Uncharacterised protein [Klebsiella michiganensis]|uniref:Uncharacterized protein n=1 Tax=Klebsiella michiganensis TaxID=1134687 RepID=A0A7H4PPV7_9ENTR|nr:Uncharacterised protein [Klebsiella michiganensis]